MSGLGGSRPKPPAGRHLAEQHLGDRLSALVDGELGHDARERVLAHVATCSKCKAEVDAQRRLKSVFSEVAPPAPSASFLARLQGLPGGDDTAEGSGPLGPGGLPGERGSRFGSRGFAGLGGFGGNRGSGGFGGAGNSGGFGGAGDSGALAGSGDSGVLGGGRGAGGFGGAGGGGVFGESGALAGPGVLGGGASGSVFEFGYLAGEEHGRAGEGVSSAAGVNGAAEGEGRSPGAGAAGSAGGASAPSARSRAGADAGARNRAGTRAGAGASARSARVQADADVNASANAVAFSASVAEKGFRVHAVGRGEERSRSMRFAFVAAGAVSLAAIALGGVTGSAPVDQTTEARGGTGSNVTPSRAPGAGAAAPDSRRRSAGPLLSQGGQGVLRDTPAAPVEVSAPLLPGIPTPVSARHEQTLRALTAPVVAGAAAMSPLIRPLSATWPTTPGLLSPGTASAPEAR
ncbi:anti-sigma factor family protein [Streptomyces roseirectus]|uniref:anti-sigma factor family protein n=1 Tax=Streptomyces roseirectus TaxID=2768066 RepID=UPI003CCDADE1